MERLSALIELVPRGARVPVPGAGPLRAGLALAGLLALGLSLALGLAASASAPAPDLLGQAAASGRVQGAVIELEHALQAGEAVLPPSLDTELRLTAAGIERSLARLARLPAPVADRRLIDRLATLEGIAAALARELEDAVAAGGGDAASARLGRLAALAPPELAALETLVERWQTANAGSIVTLERRDDQLVLLQVPRLVRDLARLGGVGLLLLGVLALALHLLRTPRRPGPAGGLGDGAAAWRPAALLARLRPRLAWPSAGLFACFFLGALTLALWPGWLAGLSAARQPVVEADACHQFAAGRARLGLARQVDSPRLAEAIGRQLQHMARECFAVGDDMAALISQETVAQQIDQPLRRTALATADEEPGEAPAPPATAYQAPLPRPDAAAAGLAAAKAPAAPQTAPSVSAATPAATAASAAPAWSRIPIVAAAPEQARPAPPPATATATAAATANAPEPPVSHVAIGAVNIRDDASIRAQRIGVLPEGEAIEVLAQEDGWSAVRLEDGRRAYISSQFLRPLP